MIHSSPESVPDFYYYYDKAVRFIVFASRIYLIFMFLLPPYNFFHSDILCLKMQLTHMKQVQSNYRLDHADKCFAFSLLHRCVPQCQYQRRVFSCQLCQHRFNIVFNFKTQVKAAW